MRRLNVVASVAAAIVVIAISGVIFELTTSDKFSSSFSSSTVTSIPSPCTVFQGPDGRITTTCSYSQSTSVCTLFLISGGFTATARATSTMGACEPLLGIIDVLGCPTTTSSLAVCSGPQYASFSAAGTSTMVSSCGVADGSNCNVVPRDQRIEIDLFGVSPTLRCSSPNCSSASLLSGVLDSCCRLADQFTFSAPGNYTFTAGWTSVPPYLTACTFVSYSTETSSSVSSPAYCTSTSGSVTATGSSTQQVSFVLTVS